MAYDKTIGVRESPIYEFCTPKLIGTSELSRLPDSCAVCLMVHALKLGFSNKNNIGQPLTYWKQYRTAIYLL
jgi:hypothetical protein